MTDHSISRMDPRIGFACTGRLLSIFPVVLACLLLLSGCRQTQTWSVVQEEIVVKRPPFSSCHASTIVETAPGKLLLAFFGGTHEGHSDVRIWLAGYENGSWSEPGVIADGVLNDSLRYPTWNPVLFRSREGRLFLFYKVGPSPREWWGMVKTSDDLGVTWNIAERLPGNLLGPVKNKPVQLADGTILSPSSTETAEAWKVHIEKSTDGGKSWQFIPVDTGSSFKAIQPSILLHGSNRLQILCRSDQDRIVEAWSEDGGETWTRLTTTELLNPNSGTDAITLSNGSHLLVYNPELRGSEWFNGRGKLHVARSSDGKKWEDILVLENEKDKEYSYPTVIETADGKVHITYTYDRKNIKHVVLGAIRP